ncbi:MAG: peptidoglycan DD-metalloendopeptidase family protein [Proteobacteria bacterium]|nr:peptidoglycan DD-metalloendopeptidase family protein [Pseudomonadota bacterium]
MILTAALLLMFGCIVALSYSPREIEKRKVTQPLDISTVPNGGVSELSKLGLFVREEIVERGDTFSTILSRLRIDNPELSKFLTASKAARKRLKLKTGDSIRSIGDHNGAITKITILSRNGNATDIIPAGTGFEIASTEFENRQLFGSGIIQSSLYKALDTNGMSDNLGPEIAEILSSKIDFNRDIRSGDQFSILYSENYLDNGYISSGQIQAIEFINRGEVHRAFFFTARKTGQSGYYTENGENIKNSFLRSPLRFSRVTSGFSTYRLHPILKKWRSHKGVDYGAPTGTPIMAASKGTIRYLGTKGAYGHFIEIHHTSGVSTRYAHLSKYAKKLKKGSKVEQGQIIGYVGASGLATGPHLHYEFLVHGNQVDPSKTIVQPGPPISKKLKKDFDSQVAAAKLLLNRLNRTATNQTNETNLIN